MLLAILALFACQLAGEVAARASGLPVPGPVLGLVLLLALLALRARLRPGAPEPDATPLGRAAGGVLAHLSVLFVPAGVGIVGQGARFGAYGAGLAAALVLSTVATLAVTALVFQAVARRTERDA